MIRGVLDEFKQRSVVRVAGIYAVAGWAVFQVVNTLFPALELPRWTVSLSALLFLAGFPVAIGLAWFFEITEGGVRLAPRDRRGFGGGRFGWIDWLVGAVVVLVFGFAVVQLVTVLRSDGEPGAPAAAPARSVAVLPFASFSEVRGDEYFADGLTEELINSLAQSEELRVAGRTSSFYFKGRNEDLRQIGRQLGVAHVVEGSVRRAGDRLQGNRAADRGEQRLPPLVGDLRPQCRRRARHPDRDRRDRRPHLAHPSGRRRAGARDQRGRLSQGADRPRAIAHAGAGATCAPPARSTAS